jgi:hypothetical protein
MELYEFLDHHPFSWMEAYEHVNDTQIVVPEGHLM